MSENIKVVTRNRKAFHEYTIEERFEAGLVLRGSEVKSLRDGKMNLVDSFIEEKEGELFLVGSHIATYVYANLLNHDPVRPRKLLLHAKEIARITKRIRERGLTAVPLQVYFKDGKAKVEIALAKGKKSYDKRDSIRKRDEGRHMERDFKERN